MLTNQRLQNVSLQEHAPPLFPEALGVEGGGVADQGVAATAARVSPEGTRDPPQQSYHVPVVFLRLRTGVDTQGRKQHARHPGRAAGSLGGGGWGWAEGQPEVLGRCFWMPGAPLPERSRTLFLQEALLRIPKTDLEWDSATRSNTLESHTLKTPFSGADRQSRQARKKTRGGRQPSVPSAAFARHR